MIFGWLVRDVHSRIAGKQVVFFTPFSSQLEQTVNSPEEGGRSVQPGVRWKEGRGGNQRERSHARV